MSPLEKEYRYLIARAIKDGRKELAKELSEWAYLKYNFEIPSS